MIKLSRIALFVAIITMISCGSTSSNDNDQGGMVTISGKLTNAAGKQLIIMRFENNRPVMLDTVDLTESGEFSMSIIVPQTDFYQLAASQKNSAILILSPGEKVTLSGNANNMRAGLSAKGSENTEILWSYYKEAEAHDKESQAIRREINKLTPGQSGQKQPLIDDFNEQNKDFLDYSKSFIDENSTSPAVLPVLGSLSMETDIDYYIIARDGLKTSFSYSTYYKDLNKNVEGFKAKQLKEKMFIPGNEVPDITQNDPYGNSRSLSSLRGNVVLIDFWASWCRPCRAENPNVVKLYNKYHKDGFDVFSVSLDKTKDKWIAAIEADGLVWKNHVSDLKYWQSEAAQLYNVSSIPFTVLIDREGKVIATKLRGGALDAKLQELFGY
jgi:peroxiredoxin